jgi:outer membrane protein OmpA-like peptidoglycan-associated protein
VGFLAPRAGNDTDDGRSLNRRVEALLTSLD